jgi:hypothetical protein
MTLLRGVPRPQRALILIILPTAAAASTILVLAGTEDWLFWAAAGIILGDSLLIAAYELARITRIQFDRWLRYSFWAAWLAFGVGLVIRDQAVAFAALFVCAVVRLGQWFGTVAEEDGVA